MPRLVMPRLVASTPNLALQASTMMMRIAPAVRRTHQQEARARHRRHLQAACLIVCRRMWLLKAGKRNATLREQKGERQLRDLVKPPASEVPQSHPCGKHCKRWGDTREN